LEAPEEFDFNLGQLKEMKRQVSKLERTEGLTKAEKEGIKQIKELFLTVEPSKEVDDKNPRRKTTAIVLAIFFGLWSWLYTYEKNKKKFWINLVLFVVTFGYWGIVAWVWAIIDFAVKPEEYFTKGYSTKINNFLIVIVVAGVFALAILILLIVFLVVPGLQRNERQHQNTNNNSLQLNQ